MNDIDVKLRIQNLFWWFWYGEEISG